MEFLKKHGLTDLYDHDAFFDLFYDEDIRFEYMSLFRDLTKCLDVVFPSKEALTFMGSFQTLAQINVMAAKHLRDERLSMKGIPAEAAQDHRRVPSVERHRGKGRTDLDS